MRVTKVYVEAKRSSNFQTYTVGFEITADKKETVNFIPEATVKEYQEKARKLCNEQIELDKKPK